MGLFVWPIAGLVTWTLLEYLLHRFAFHAPTRFLGRRHVAHHADVATRRLTPAAPLPVALVSAAAIFASHRLAGRAGLLFIAGLLAGYLAYELIHYAVHYWRLESGWFRALKRYHLSHHFQSARVRFGVSSPLWDLVFGTYRLPVRRR